MTGGSASIYGPGQEGPRRTCAVRPTWSPVGMPERWGRHAPPAARVERPGERASRLKVLRSGNGDASGQQRRDGDEEMAIHSEPYGEQWASRREGAERVSRVYPTKTAAQSAGRDQARRDARRRADDSSRLQTHTSPIGEDGAMVAHRRYSEETRALALRLVHEYGPGRGAIARVARELNVRNTLRNWVREAR